MKMEKRHKGEATNIQSRPLHQDLKGKYTDQHIGMLASQQEALLSKIDILCR